jgi:hypothetical protein
MFAAIRTSLRRSCSRGDRFCRFRHPGWRTYLRPAVWTKRCTLLQGRSTFSAIHIHLPKGLGS